MACAFARYLRYGGEDFRRRRTRYRRPEWGGGQEWAALATAGEAAASRAHVLGRHRDAVLVNLEPARMARRGPERAVGLLCLALSLDPLEVSGLVALGIVVVLLEGVLEVLRLPAR